MEDFTFAKDWALVEVRLRESGATDTVVSALREMYYLGAYTLSAKHDSAARAMTTAIDTGSVENITKTGLVCAVFLADVNKEIAETVQTLATSRYLKGINQRAAEFVAAHKENPQ